MNVHAFDRRRVEIFWWDAVGPVDLEPGEELLPVLCSDIGYVVKETDTAITFATGLREDDEKRHGCSTVRKCCIEKIVELAPRYKDSGG